MMEILIGKKEKRTNKETHKQYVANSLIHDTIYHTQCLYQISKSWELDVRVYLECILVPKAEMSLCVNL